MGWIIAALALGVAALVAKLRGAGSGASSSAPPTGAPTAVPMAIDGSGAPKGYVQAQALRAVLAGYPTSGPEVAAAAKAFASAAGVKLVPGAGYVEAVRQAAAATLGQDPSSWPPPPSGVY